MRIRRTDRNVEAGDSPDRETTSRPDSVNDTIVHEHKHFMGGDGDQVVYDTAQMRNQRDWAADNQKEHVVTISSDSGYGPDGLLNQNPLAPG